ncbi:helix-turn-helix transcriptional regulator, partial [Thioclava sp. BHET1]
MARANLESDLTLPCHPPDPGPDYRSTAASRRREKMRLRLIEATVIRLALQGPEGLVVEQITGTAAVARGSFYRHFTSVDDAIEAAKRALTADLIATAKGLAET